MNRPIIFTSRKIPNNSFWMRGEQMAGAIRALGYDCRIMAKEEVAKVSGAVVIWVRRRPEGDIARKCFENNITLLDPLDRVADLKNPVTVCGLDAILFSSSSQHHNYSRLYPLMHTNLYWLHHHYDPRLIKYDFNTFELGYWGYRTSACHVLNVIDRRNRITSARCGEFPTEDFFRRISCHYNVRDEKRGFGWRPTTKISVASACGANIIASRDSISLELLPKDYPYFTESFELKDVLRTIDLARRTFQKDEWNYGLNCMEKVRQQTSLEVCAKKYVEIIEDLVSRVRR